MPDFFRASSALDFSKPISRRFSKSVGAMAGRSDIRRRYRVSQVQYQKADRIPKIVVEGVNIELSLRK